MRKMLLHLLFAGLSVSAPAQDLEPIRVEACDLFRDPSAFNGKMVAASGVIQILPGSGETGPWLSTTACPVRISVKGFEYADTISITPPWYPPIFFDHKVDFTWDRTNYAELNALMKKMDARTEQIRATVVGLFETRVPTDLLVIATASHPEGQRNGYGHQNQDPAQIIVKTVTGMHIEKKEEAPR